MSVGSLIYIDARTQTATFAIGALTFSASCGPLIFPALVGVISDAFGSIRLGLILAPSTVAVVFIATQAFIWVMRYRQRVQAHSYPVVVNETSAV